MYFKKGFKVLVLILIILSLLLSACSSKETSTDAKNTDTKKEQKTLRILNQRRWWKNS